MRTRGRKACAARVGAFDGPAQDERPALAPDFLLYGLMMNNKSVRELLGERTTPSPPPDRATERDVIRHLDADGADQAPSLLLRFSYCLVLLAAVVPFGLAKSGWVALATVWGSPSIGCTSWRDAAC